MNRREALKKTVFLGGTALASTSMLTLLQSCQQQSRLDWQPLFLSVDHAQLVSSLVDTILPTTDTPGGLDVKLDMFIDLIYAKSLDENAQQQQVQELDAFNQKCTDQFGSAFHQLDADQKKTILMAEESKSPKFNGGVWGTAVGEQEPVGFYRSLKSLMLWGYFTSEAIGKDVLNYDPIPGEYKGCVPLSEVGKVWSL
ncbi:MAG: gluconate 2-dehydrogenase subunit 3 family protein [Rhodothermaceae bacterium]|nr:gluconate 2-dehydrogenase subunit 3 family protein [Rhodothermaceae bacterium]